MSAPHRLNLGAGEYRADGWLNVDVPGTPYDVDLEANVLDGLPYDDRSSSAVFLGHVLEHVPWDSIPEFLAEVRRVAHGPVCVVGPDIVRVLEASFLAGVPDWPLLDSTLEGDGVHMTDRVPWAEARHAWNCTEARVDRAMTAAGFVKVESYTGRLEDLRPDWPLVSGVDWQFGAVYL